MLSSESPIIRKEYQSGLYTKTALAKKYHCSRQTIYNILNRTEDQDVYIRTSHPENCLIQPYRKMIYNWLKKSNAEATAIWRKLIMLGAHISKSTVTKEVAKIKYQLDIEAIRYETTPGQQAQADWGEFPGFTANVNGKQQPIYAFFLILGYSRTKFVEFTTKMTTDVLIKCIEDALYYYAGKCPSGGCPNEILFDNMPQVVNRCIKNRWEKNKAQEILPEFSSFADRTGFNIRLARIRRPQEKGKVERFVQFFKNNFMQALEKKSNHTLSDLNKKAIKWCNQVNSEKHHTTGEIPFDRLKKENLKPLPKTRYSEDSTIYVQKDGSVFFHGGIYQVDPRFAGYTGTAQDCCPVIFANIDGEFIILGKRNLPVHTRHRYYIKGSDLDDPIRLSKKSETSISYSNTDPSDYHNIICSLNNSHFRLSRKTITNIKSMQSWIRILYPRILLNKKGDLQSK